MSLRANFSTVRFQSTLPARGATCVHSSHVRPYVIFQSTLPARGATCALQQHPQNSYDFNPRSLHGERLTSSLVMMQMEIFQSTLPARGATTDNPYCDLTDGISIHAPCTGSDEFGCDESLAGSDFNPRSLHGERRLRLSPERGGQDFNPRSLHGERPRKVTILSIRIIGFAQKVYHKTVLLRISLAENAVILPKRPQNPVRTSLQKAGGLRFARAIRAARPYSISSPSGA